jgi:phosphoketolase
LRGLFHGVYTAWQSRKTTYQPETKQDLKLEWYKRGYKQGFVDGQDVPHRKLDYFTDIILGEDNEK